MSWLLNHKDILILHNNVYFFMFQETTGCTRKSPLNRWIQSTKMNKVPAECNMGNSLTCWKCDKVLPPCKSFADLYVTSLHGDRFYVFNGGEYYRPYELFMHECKCCFNKPTSAQDKMTTVPVESKMGDRLRCWKCDKVLPPCTSFNDLYVDTVRGRRVYVFNRGEYYRPVDHFLYECKCCFK